MASLPAALASIPSPPTNGIHVGPLFIHVYGLMYVVGIGLAIYITGRRWAAAGGDRSLVSDVALWAVPARIVGAWRVRRAGASVGVFMNAVAPALLVAQAVGRIGNYFNQELFGKPSN